MTPSEPAAGSPFRCVLDARASLGECPVWSGAEQVLYWVDINAPSLNRFDPATGRNTAMPMPESIGCFALREGGGFVVALRGGFWLAAADGTLTRKVGDAPYDPAHHRFNDGRCDHQGRLLAGYMNEARDASTAALVRLDPDFTQTQVLSDMTISNGLAWSPDGRTMYHADTPTQIIRAYDYDAASGTPSQSPRVRALHRRRRSPRRRRRRQRRLLLDRFLPRRQGAADRAHRAGAGRIRGARDVPDDVRVRRPRPPHALRDERTPAASPMTSSAACPQSGGLFAMTVDVPGLPEPAFAG